MHKILLFEIGREQLVVDAMTELQTVKYLGVPLPQRTVRNDISGRGSNIAPASQHYKGTVGYDSPALRLLVTQDEIEYLARWPWNFRHGQPSMECGGITPKQKLALAA